MHKRDIAFLIFQVAMLAVLIWLGRSKSKPAIPWYGIGFLYVILSLPTLGVYGWGVAKDGSRGQEISQSLLRGVGQVADAARV